MTVSGPAMRTRTPLSRRLAVRWSWPTWLPVATIPWSATTCAPTGWLGAALRVAGQADQAEAHLNEALERCRRINLVENEAEILTDLARLRAAAGAGDEAQRLAEEAFLIAERCGYVLKEADARLELARLALARGDGSTAREHAQQAHRLAACDGPPDYTYAAAYAEASALLEQLQRRAR